MAEQMDSSKRVSPEQARTIRETRVAEPFVFVDTIVIGPGARTRDPGWFDTWQQFADASEVVWHTRRNPNVGEAYTNRPTERLDYAFDLYKLGIDFYAPSGMARHELDFIDGSIMPMLFGDELIRCMSFSLDISSTDNLLKIRGDKAPAGGASSGFFADASPAGIVHASQNGTPQFRNMFSFPEPVMVPASATLTVTSRVNDPIKAYFSQLTTSPGNKLLPLPNPAGGVQQFVFYPNWYKIAVFYVGARYLQIRGARSAPGST